MTHLITVVLNKPKGVVSTMSDPDGRPALEQIRDRTSTSGYSTWAGSTRTRRACCC